MVRDEQYPMDTVIDSFYHIIPLTFYNLEITITKPRECDVVPFTVNSLGNEEAITVKPL
jgi:hypothetical protein